MAEEQAFQGENFADLFARSEGSGKLRKGDTVRGVIVQLDKEFAFIDIGSKGEAMLAVAELRDEQGQLTVKVGDTVEAAIMSFKDGSAILSRSLRRSQQNREMLANAYELGVPVEGRVTGRNKGGFEVDLSGLRGFCPISQIDSSYVEDPEPYVGQTYSFAITEYAEDGKRLVLSRRQLLEAERAEKAEETRAMLFEGSEFTGTVKSIRPFGVFVDIGGLEGLVHVSELSHRRIADPASFCKVGDNFKVRVKGIEKDAKGKERISLSIKVFEEDPWTAAERSLQPGTLVTGTVSRLAPFGAFVELLPGVDGLIHISELADRRVANARDVVSEGQSVSVKILEIDWDKQRIALSLRQALAENAPPPTNPDGTISDGVLREGIVVTGKVHALKPFGVLLRLPPQYGDVVGLLPIEDSGAAGPLELKKKYAPDQEVQVAVESYDPATRRVRFSLKALEEIQARQEFAQYQAQGSAKGFGTFGDLLAKAAAKGKK